MIRQAAAAAALALLTLAACASTNEDGPGQQDLLVQIGISQAIGLANDLVAVYGVEIPESATETVVATRNYAQALCSVAVDGAPVGDLDGPRVTFDQAFADLVTRDDLEPGLMVALLRLKGTALDVTEIVLRPGTDGEKFRVPCDRLRALPEILPRL